MWYDKKNMRMLFMFGAALAFVALGLIRMDHALPGAILLCFSVGLVIIAFAVLRLQMVLSFRK